MGESFHDEHRPNQKRENPRIAGLIRGMKSRLNLNNRGTVKQCQRWAESREGDCPGFIQVRHLCNDLQWLGPTLLAQSLDCTGYAGPGIFPSRGQASVNNVPLTRDRRPTQPPVSYGGLPNLTSRKSVWDVLLLPLARGGNRQLAIGSRPSGFQRTEYFFFLSFLFLGENPIAERAIFRKSPDLKEWKQALARGVLATVNFRGVFFLSRPGRTQGLGPWVTQLGFESVPTTGRKGSQPKISSIPSIPRTFWGFSILARNELLFR